MEIDLQAQITHLCQKAGYPEPLLSGAGVPGPWPPRILTAAIRRLPLDTRSNFTTFLNLLLSHTRNLVSFNFQLTTFTIEDLDFALQTHLYIDPETNQKPRNSHFRRDQGDTRQQHQDTPLIDSCKTQ